MLYRVKGRCICILEDCSICQNRYKYMFRYKRILLKYDGDMSGVVRNFDMCL